MKKIILLSVIVLSLFFANNASAMTLRMGLRGNSEVVKLQKNLRKLGVYSGAIDGNFGQKTKNAVMAFQSSVKISPDGVVGPKTQYIMKDRIGLGLVVTVNDLNYSTLCADGKPHLQVLSPDGGESYVTSEEITVEWKSCNADKGLSASILLCYTTPSGGARCNALNKDSKTLLGSGSEKVTIMNNSDLGFFNTTDINGRPDFGKKYGIQVTSRVANPGPDLDSFSDLSDSSFTISDK
jgi:peptidoglycan hydrolase-like protein with peptidoglycan-binding domain